MLHLAFDVQEHRQNERYTEKKGIIKLEIPQMINYYKISIKTYSLENINRKCQCKWELIRSF